MSGPRHIFAVFGLVATLTIVTRSEHKRSEAETEIEEPIFWPAWKPADAGTPPAAMFGRNLLINGNAEATQKETAGLPGWSPRDRATAAAYGSSAGEPDERTPGPPDRGQRYFRCRVFGGGPKPGDAVTQTLDVIAVAGDIDAGKVRCKLTGWFGGRAGADAYLKIIFRDGKGNELGTLQTDPGSDRRETAKLTERVKEGRVAKGTRRIDVVLQFYSSGAEMSETVAIADNLSLVFTK